MTYARAHDWHKLCKAEKIINAPSNNFTVKLAFGVLGRSSVIIDRESQPRCSLPDGASRDGANDRSSSSQNQNLETASKLSKFRTRKIGGPYANKTTNSS